MNPECEKFELHIGMRQHGALGGHEVAALDAHLASCGECRAFAAASDGIDTSLRRHAGREAAQVDWARVQAGVEGLARGQRTKLWLTPFVLLCFPLALLISGGHVARPLLLAVLPGNLVIYLAYVWLIGRPFREVLAVAQSGDSLLAGYVRELRRQRLRTWIFVVCNAAAAIFLLANAIIEPGLRLRLFGLVFGLGFAAWAGYDLGARLPRLGRALAEVKS